MRMKSCRYCCVGPDLDYVMAVVAGSSWVSESMVVVVRRSTEFRIEIFIPRWYDRELMTRLRAC